MSSIVKSLRSYPDMLPPYEQIKEKDHEKRNKVYCYTCKHICSKSFAQIQQIFKSSPKHFCKKECLNKYVTSENRLK
jgi:hypothetical protein